MTACRPNPTGRRERRAAEPCAMPAVRLVTPTRGARAATDLQSRVAAAPGESLEDQTEKVGVTEARATAAQLPTAGDRKPGAETLGLEERSGTGQSRRISHSTHAGYAVDIHVPTSLSAFVISTPALPLAAWPWSKSGRGGLAEGIIGFETVGTPPRPPPSTPPSSSPWGSTHFQQEAPKVKAEDNVESLTPNYCNRVWGITVGMDFCPAGSLVDSEDIQCLCFISAFRCGCSSKHGSTPRESTSPCPSSSTRRLTQSLSATLEIYPGSPSSSLGLNHSQVQVGVHSALQSHRISKEDLVRCSWQQTGDLLRTRPGRCFSTDACIWTATWRRFSGSTDWICHGCRGTDWR